MGEKAKQSSMRHGVSIALLAAGFLGSSLASAAPPETPSATTHPGLTMRIVDDAPDAAKRAGNVRVMWEGKTIWLKPDDAIAGDMVSSARQIVDHGAPAISFALTDHGRERLARLSSNTGQRFAIMVDGRVVIAPTIMSPITGGSGTITGKFTTAEAGAMAAAIMSKANIP